MTWKGRKGKQGYLLIFSPFTLIHSRAATSSLTDLEMKLNKAIERNAILENEIIAKDNLTEQAQRLRDELNGKINNILLDKHDTLIMFT